MKERENDLNAEATKIDREAAIARKSGRDAEADDLELKAEKKRSKADAYGYRAEDLLRENAKRPEVSSIARIGGAAGEATGATTDYAKSQLEETKRTRSAVESMTKEIEGLRADMKRGGWSEEDNDY